MSNPSKKEIALPIEPILFSRRQAAQVLNVCPQTLDNLIAAGDLPTVMISSRKLIPAAALKEFALTGRTGRLRK